MTKIINKLYHINKNEIGSLEKEAKDKDYYLIILDGKKIQNEGNYLKQMHLKYDMPTFGVNLDEIEDDELNFDSYMDWIRDLD